jgi:proteasome lid subunit RPN8/RPN11
VFYDDVDPDSLSTGIVVIDGRRLGDLWSYCRKTGRKVVADVHVHPGGYAQSTSDQANPIMAEVGHVAIILPDFAQRSTAPGGIGFYRYLGSRKWRDQSREFPRPMHVGWWPQWR